MGNELKGKKKNKNVKKIPTAMEVKTYIMVAQGKLNLYRNKKVNMIKQKRREIANYLRQNNLDVAKAKMDSLIREEDIITAYDILGPICEILKERVTYLMNSEQPPADIRAHLDTVIYAATRMEVGELHTLRDLLKMKYGESYVTEADTNSNHLVNVNLVEKLKVKPAADAFITIRLKQLCKEENLKFEFPCEIIPEQFNPDLNQMGGFGGNMYNTSGNFNPYSSQNQGQWNPSNQGGNFGNNDFSNPYGGNDFSNPFGNNQNQGGFNQNQGGFNQNPNFGGQNEEGGFKDYFNNINKSQNFQNPNNDQFGANNQMNQNNMNPYNQGNEKKSQFGYNQNEILKNQSGFNPYTNDQDNMFPDIPKSDNANNFPKNPSQMGPSDFPKNPSQMGPSDFPKNPSQMGPSDFPKNPSQMGPSDFPKNPSQMGPSDFPKNPSQMGPSDFPKNPSQMGPSDFPKNPSQMGPSDFPKNPSQMGPSDFPKNPSQMEKSFKNEPINDNDLNPYASQNQFKIDFNENFNPYSNELGDINFMGNDNGDLPTVKSQIQHEEKKE